MLSNKSWDLSKYLVLLSLESEMQAANFLYKIFVYVYSTRVTASANLICWGIFIGTCISMDIDEYQWRKMISELYQNFC